MDPLVLLLRKLTGLKRVSSRAAQANIVSGTTIDFVITATAKDTIIASLPLNLVVAGCTQDQVIVATANTSTLSLAVNDGRDGDPAAFIWQELFQQDSLGG